MLKQLHSLSESLIGNQDSRLNKIAELIYKTDPYIYPCLFDSLDIAKRIITECIKTGQDSMFCTNNLYVAEKNGAVVAIILWHDGPMHWDVKTILSVFDSLNTQTPPLFQKVCREYFSTYSKVPEGVISLINVCVDADYQDMGIGTELLASFIKQHPNRRMELFVLENNEKAIRMYEKAGFTKTGQLNGFSSDDRKLPCLKMERDVDFCNDCNNKSQIGSFSCLGRDCQSHCCGAYTGFSDCLRSLEGNSFSEIILLPEDVAALKAIGRKDLIKRNSKGYYIIATEPDGTCHAFKDGRCSIYGSRPSICKAYPLYLDMFVGMVEQRECPAVEKCQTNVYEKETIESLLAVYEYWIHHYRNN